MAGPIRPINPSSINPLIPSDEPTQAAQQLSEEEQAAAAAQRLVPPKRSAKFSADPQAVFFEEDKFTRDDAVVPVARKEESQAPDDSPLLYEQRVEAGEEMGAFSVLAKELSDEKLRPGPSAETDYKIALGKKPGDSPVRLPEQAEASADQPTPEQVASYNVIASRYSRIPEFNGRITFETVQNYYAAHNPDAEKALRQVRNLRTEPASHVYLAGVAETGRTRQSVPLLDYNLGAQPIRDAVGATSYYASLFSIAA